MTGTPTNDLLLEIAHCTNVLACSENPGQEHPCREVVLTQRSTSVAEHQLPEPWSGHLEQAPILFLASNPSIDQEEEYPLGSWPDELVADFFRNRFGGGRKQWTKDERYTLRRHGTHYRRGVQFWASVRNRAGELLDRDAIPGVDYVMSEVVHCKSVAEKGVWAALDECAGRYLRRVVERAAARVIVCLGEVADYAVRREFGLPKSVPACGPVRVRRRDRYFTFLPHPNARKPRTFERCLPPRALRRLRELLTKS